MGRAKQEWMEAQERGWTAPDNKFVCEQCVADSHLGSVIRAHASEKSCSYCGDEAERPIAAPLDVLVGSVAETVHHYFGDPADVGVPWDEGEYCADLMETGDVLQALGVEWRDELFEDVAESFDTLEWVRAAYGHWASSYDHEVLSDSWNAFANLILYDTRFHFHVAPLEGAEGPQELEPGQILPAIAKVIESVGLLKVLRAGSTFHRSRPRPDGATWPVNEQELSAPPSEHARAGRMNPPGISYLYLAFDAATAIAETTTTPSTVAIAEFKATRDLNVVDLTVLPELPSIFDNSKRGRREELLFLQSFTAEISKPVPKDGTEHLNYVPSQVVCEYLAQIMRVSDGTTIDGLVYRSAVHEGGKNLVLFPTDRGWNRSFSTAAFVKAETISTNLAT